MVAGELDIEAEAEAEKPDIGIVAGESGIEVAEQPRIVGSEVVLLSVVAQSGQRSEGSTQQPLPLLCFDQMLRRVGTFSFRW